MNKQLIKTTTDVNGKTLGMAWYNFLVRFALIASAIINFLFSLTYLTGTIYNGQLTAEEVYSYYGETLRAVDILFGLFMIGFGVLAIIVRNKLAKYESDAPKFVYILYALSAGLPFVYSVIVAIITSQFITLNAIITLISGLVILFLNIKYFKKRAHLFISKATSTQATQKEHQQSTPLSATPVQPISAHSRCDTKKVGNYGIIESSLSTDFTENARNIIKQQIEIVINENNLVRKTDLMKVIFGYVNQEFASAKGSKADLIVCAYYQIAFDEIVKLCEDMNDLIFNYAISKMSGTISKDIHKYLQVLVRIQLIIDDAITTCKNHNSYQGYLKQLKSQVFNELNSYIDDATDWNKLPQREQSRIEP